MLNNLIVYVEDNPDDAFFVSRALEQARHSGEFRHLSTIPAAKDYFASLKRVPGLVLVDLHIGADSSKDLISFLRGLEPFQKVPIVTLSGSYVYDDLDKSYETGANLFMVKPQDLKGWTGMILRLRDYFPAQV